MKKILLLLLLLAGTGNFINAQDLDQLITDLAKIDEVQHQLVDKAMLDSQMGQAIAADSTGELKSKMPAFLKKIEGIETVILENSSDEIKEKVSSELTKINEGKVYESLLKVKQKEADVNIIAKKGKGKSDIFVIVIADSTIVAIKMTGDLSEQDLIEITKEVKIN